MIDSKKILTLDSCAKAWENIKPPVRPSKQMLAIYEGYIGDYVSSNKDWGILGSTPELRSLGAKYASSVCCLDLKHEHYYSFSTLCRQHPKESFLQCNWLSTGQAEKFNYVLGDGSTSMVSLHQYDDFLNSIHDLLLPGGYAFLRIQIANTNPFGNPSEVVAWHRANHPSQPIFRTSSFYLQILWQDANLGSVNTEIYCRELLALFEAGIITSDEYQELMSSITPYPISYVEQESFEAFCAPLFTILDVRFPNDFACSNLCPVYALQKK
ncbi:hypothetical protein JR334_11330 [Clostridia bacterium]|nr:hypothetical protein JR334_11330 [Clostridia bacterium]